MNIILMGALAALPFLLLVHFRSPARRRRLLAFALFLASMVYAFTAGYTAPTQWVLIELAGLILFAVLAYLGVHRSLNFLFLGWTAHIAWDMGLHSAEGTPYISLWYPHLCVGFDAIVALYIRWLMIRERGAVKQQAPIDGP